MTDPRPSKDLPPAALAANETEAGGPVIRRAISPTGESGSVEPALGEPRPVNELTTEEQMALFEKELKEKDWGHQPC